MAIQNKAQRGGEARVTVSFSDSINLIKKQIRWSPKGVSLLTKWPFRVGAEVEFAFDHRGERHCCTGVVVACHPLRRPSGFYEIVLFFVETPCSELQKAACDCRLAQEEQDRRDESRLGSDDHAMDGAARDGAGASSRLRSAQARR
ncbi:MAG TPA: hypothetical protein VGZ93_06870 [Candidatus Methylacidiphilales bacterium]|jgi:hypothetical protein|nr:hypothetical protein [Candidatus Methylacidiphilales bacterium]